jgi:hypothetical protein
MSTQSRAMLTSVAILAGMCLAGPVLRLVIDPHGYNQGFWYGSIYSPAAVAAELLWTRLEASDLIFLLLANTIGYGGLAVCFRVACTLQASRFLGRSENATHVVADQREDDIVVDREARPVQAGEIA